MVERVLLNRPLGRVHCGGRLNSSDEMASSKGGVLFAEYSVHVIQRLLLHEDFLHGLLDQLR